MSSTDNHNIQLPDVEVLGATYTVPSGYFSLLPQKLLLRVKAASVSDTPAGYFDELPGKLLLRIKALEAAETSETPTLDKIGKKMPYTVPDGYFQQFTVRPVVHAPTGKVVSMRRMVSWAVAACLVVLLGLTLWTFVGKSENQQSNAVELAALGLADLPDDVFAEMSEGKGVPTANSLQVAIGWKTADNALEGFSEEDLQHYLQESGLEALYAN